MRVGSPAIVFTVNIWTVSSSSNLSQNTHFSHPHLARVSSVSWLSFTVNRALLLEIKYTWKSQSFEKVYILQYMICKWPNFTSEDTLIMRTNHMSEALDQGFLILNHGGNVPQSINIHISHMFIVYVLHHSGGLWPQRGQLHFSLPKFSF